MPVDQNLQKTPDKYCLLAQARAACEALASSNSMPPSGFAARK